MDKSTPYLLLFCKRCDKVVKFWVEQVGQIRLLRCDVGIAPYKDFAREAKIL